MPSKAKMKSIPADCSICTEKFNTSTRTPIKCPNCAKHVCQTCIRSYLLSSPSTNPQCMYPDCDKPWTFEYLASVTPKNFHNKIYRDYRAGIVMQLERSLLPATQHLVARKLKQKEIQVDMDYLVADIKYYQKIIDEKKRRVNRLKQQMFALNTRDVDDLERGQEDEKEEKKEEKKETFIRPCPSNTCKGYLSKALKCGICECWGCKDCHREKKSRDDDEHECDPDEVATVKLLKNDTKPCPNCTVPIYKLNGCDQMWCTACRTPFEWNTLRIVNAQTETIHNPHFYAHQREQNNGIAPRVAGDFRCGGVPTINRVERKMKSLKCTPEVIHTVMNAHRLIGHINGAVLPNYPNRMDMENNADLRVKYLLGELSDKKWASELKKREKKREKNRAVNLVLTMFTATLGDLMANIVDSDRDKRITYIPELMNLKTYVNKELAKISSRFNNKINPVTDNWEMVTASMARYRTRRANIDARWRQRGARRVGRQLGRRARGQLGGLIGEY